MEDGIAKCTIPTTHRGEEVIYEVELNTIANTITMRRIENESPLADFLRTETRLSTLNKGDKFRLEGDCVVYAYYGACERYSNTKYGFIRVDNNQLCLGVHHIHYNKDINKGLSKRTDNPLLALNTGGYLGIVIIPLFIDTPLPRAIPRGRRIFASKSALTAIRRLALWVI